MDPGGYVVEKKGLRGLVLDVRTYMYVHNGALRAQDGACIGALRPRVYPPLRPVRERVIVRDKRSLMGRLYPYSHGLSI